MIKDMTKGKPSKTLWLFSIPMLLSVMFQQIYNIADSMIAGRYVGEDALAAIGSSYPITMIYMAIAMGCNIGCSVVISQLFGGKKLTEMKTAVSTTFLASTALSIILTIPGLLLCEPLLQLCRTPDNVMSDASVYLGIYTGGVVFLFLYNICTGIFTALGDSRTPLYFLIASSIGNILLDLAFVCLFHMGVAGVAWATFLAQGISCALSVITLFLRLRKIKGGENTQEQQKSRIFSGRMLLKISMIAVPSILQQSFISIGNLLIQRVVNGYGSSVIAGYSAAIKLNTFAITSFTTLANGLSSYSAQNIGAGKPARVKSGFHAGIVMALCVVIPFFTAFFFFDKTMLSLFLDSDSLTAAQTGREFLKIVSPFYFIISIKLMADGVLRGAGSMLCFMAATFSDLLLRVILAYVLSPTFHTTGMWWSWPIGWTIATLLSCTFYFSGVWLPKEKG